MGRTTGLGRADVARCWAGFASLGAGLIHLAVVQEHFDEWWLYGTFFLAVGVAQIIWAVVALAKDNPPWRLLTAWCNVAIVVLWAVTRTTGLPIGPEPGQAEAVGRADVLCGVLELVVFGALIAVPWLAARDERTAGRRRVGRFVALVFAGALAVLAITTPALAATPAGGGGMEHMDGMAHLDGR
ncbi:MAG TPA: hypothetical protein VH857_05105 [Actinomycetes bacterium]|jgi:hypothetical protein|nr:hypothetical protein [Actinomycetes bacterium]